MNTGGFALYTQAAREAPGGGNTVSVLALGPGVLRGLNGAAYANALRACISPTTNFRSLLRTRFVSPARAMTTSRSQSATVRGAAPIFQKTSRSRLATTSVSAVSGLQGRDSL